MEHSEWSRVVQQVTLYTFRATQKTNDDPMILTAITIVGTRQLAFISFTMGATAHGSQIIHQNFCSFARFTNWIL